MIHIEDQGFPANCNILSKRLAETGYKKAEICSSISKTSSKNRKDLLKQNKIPSSRILLLIYNDTLPNVKEGVKKNWNVLKMNNELRDIFAEPPLMCFSKNKTLKDFLLR